MKCNKFISIMSFVFCVLTLIMGILILPGITNIGVIVLQYLLAALILSYVFFILLYKAIKKTDVNQILAIIEMVLDIVIAVMLILNFKLKFIVFNELFYVMMLVLFIHALFSIISGFYENRKNSKNYPLYGLLVDICLMIFSILGFIFPIIDNNLLIIVTSCFCFVCSIISLILGILKIKHLKKELVITRVNN